MMDFQSTLQSTRSRGYWEISFYPAEVTLRLSTDEGPLALPDLKKLIVENAVQFRGWDYPHCPTVERPHQNMYVMANAIEAWTDWEVHKELWRFHESGKFNHILGVREDWYTEVNYNNRALQGIVPGSSLDVFGTLFTLTELFGFLRNLMQADVFKDGIYLTIRLRNTKDRRLVILDPMRVGLFAEYRNHVQDLTVLENRKFGVEEIRQNFKELALETATRVFHQFNWDDPPTSTLIDDQLKLLERRLG